MPRPKRGKTRGPSHNTSDDKQEQHNGIPPFAYHPKRVALFFLAILCVVGMKVVLEVQIPQTSSFLRNTRTDQKYTVLSDTSSTTEEVEALKSQLAQVKQELNATKELLLEQTNQQAAAAAAATTTTTFAAATGNEVMIVDAIQYNGERAVLFRLKMLFPVVDHFYITESKVTHSGAEKPLYSEVYQDQFAPYASKITWLVFDPTGSNGNWGREVDQRGFALETIKKDVAAGSIQLPFLIINTDGDEIPNPKVIAEFQPGKTWHDKVIAQPMVFEMDMWYYNCNWKNKQTNMAERSYSARRSYLGRNLLSTGPSR